MKGMKIFYSLVNRFQTLKISLGRIRSVLWPQRHYQSWMSLPSLCCGYSHTTHAAGPHLNPSWGTQTLFQLCQRSPGLRPCFMDGRPMLQPHVHPWLCLCPFLLSNAPPGWTMSWLICCFACGCQWTLTAAWCVQTPWDRRRAAPLSLLPGILGSCFEIKQLWVCTEQALSNVK